MSTNILDTCNIIAICENEYLREKVFAILSIEGWGSKADFPENDEASLVFLRKDPEQSLVLILESNGLKVQKTIQDVLQLGYSPNRVLLGCPPNSFTHRFLGKQGIALFPYSTKKTPTGLEIDLKSMPNTILRAWKNVFSTQLEQEVKKVVNSGTLALLGSVLKFKSVGPLKERTSSNRPAFLF